MTAIGPLVTIAVPIEISGKAPSAHLETLTHPGAGSPLPGWYGTLARPAASASGQSLWRCINGIGVCLRREAGLPQRGVGALDRVGDKLIGGAIGVIVDLLAGNAGAMIGLRRSHRLDPGLQRQGRRCPCPATAAVALSLVGARRGAP